MRRQPAFLHVAVIFTVILTALFICWTAAYYATGFIYSQAGWTPHGLPALLINAMLGFLLFGTIIGLVGPYIRPKEHRLFAETLEALRRISRGDFRIHIQPDIQQGNGKNRGGQRHPFVELAHSINDMAANLKAMEELRQQFVSNVSHEIGTPLASISGFARALKNEGLDREQRNRYLGIIETECVRLSKLSDNLMKLAVLDSDRHPYHPKPYRLDKQLISLILACEPQWEEKGIDMNVDTVPIEAVADEQLMSQVWTNLLHNAIKFAPENGRIDVSASAAGDRAVVRIADNGPGIAEEDLPRIFERFYKADKSRTRTAGGSGLGLSIAHKIVEMNGCTISVRSTPGDGAAFTVTVPLR